MRIFAAALARPDGAPALFNDGTVDSPQLELPAAPEGVAVFDDSGFVVVRDGPLWLAFRCGPPAPAFLPAHAHADALSFQLWWRGRPVVVDPGAFTYEPGSERNWFRSTRAHSTIAVDGRDQFRLWGAFRSGPLPKVSLRYAREQAVEASVVLPGRMRHVRRIEWAGNEVWVYDQLEGKGRHRVESRLVWAPERAEVELELLGGGELAVDEGFVSERFGERVTTAVTAVRADLELPASLGFRLRCPD
jgi:hypothetical protein